MKVASLKEVKDKLSEFLKTAEKEDVIITKNGKPNAVLHHLGDDELEDYLLEHDPRFRKKSSGAGRNIWRKEAVRWKKS